MKTFFKVRYSEQTVISLYFGRRSNLIEIRTYNALYRQTCLNRVKDPLSYFNQSRLTKNHVYGQRLNIPFVKNNISFPIEILYSVIECQLVRYSLRQEVFAYVIVFIEVKVKESHMTSCSDCRLSD